MPVAFALLVSRGYERDLDVVQFCRGSSNVTEGEQHGMSFQFSN